MILFVKNVTKFPTILKLLLGVTPFQKSTYSLFSPRYDILLFSANSRGLKYYLTNFWATRHLSMQSQIRVRFVSQLGSMTPFASAAISQKFITKLKFCPTLYVVGSLLSVISYKLGHHHVLPEYKGTNSSFRAKSFTFSKTAVHSIAS